MGRSARSYPIPGSSGVLGVSSSENLYFGFTLAETAGATAKVRLREATVTGTILDSITLGANESTDDWYGPQGMYVNGDIYVQLVSGTVEGSVRAG